MGEREREWLVLRNNSTNESRHGGCVLRVYSGRLLWCQHHIVDIDKGSHSMGLQLLVLKGHYSSILAQRRLLHGVLMRQ